MIIESNIKEKLKIELAQSTSIWIATAMISNSGWSFIQKQLSKDVIQHYLIGIDLSTHPSVFQSILENLEINAHVFKNEFTFHPKVYIIQKSDNSLTAFIGSSNTTNWGLEKNVEMNFQIYDQVECKKLINWFNRLFKEGKLVTQEFLNDYKIKFVKASKSTKEVESDAQLIKKELTKDKGQFFSSNQHEIFKIEYHRINSENLKTIRKSVRDKLRELHFQIYPRFKQNGLTDIYCHHQSREIVSRHFFNPFSGNYIDAMWLHYGKSLAYLKSYSDEKEKSFINNLRLQVIVLEKSIGIWLVLGKNWGSKIDRDFFRAEMQKSSILNNFYTALKMLDDSYWIEFDGYSKRVWVKDIKSPNQLHSITMKENIERYFIIGCDIDWLDKRISSDNISTTVLNEFSKLDPLYIMMRHN